MAIKLLGKSSFHQESFHQPLIDNPETQGQRIIFKLIQKVGSFGKYQKLSLIVWCTIGYIQGGLNLIIPYLFFQDPYDCPFDPEEQSCLTYVCNLSPSQRQAFLPQNSMNTISNQFGDYRCSAEQKIVDGMVLLIYSSLTLSYLLLTFYGDYLGRKTFLVIGVSCIVIGLVISVTSVNLYIAVAGLFIAFFGSQWSYNFAMSFMSQTISQDYRQTFMTYFFLAYGIGQCANVGYFYGLADWRLVLIICYIIPAVIVLLLVVFFIVQTPISLIKFHSQEEVKKQLLRIAKVNKIEEVSLKQSEIRKVKQLHMVRADEQSQSSTFGLLDIFKYPSVRFLTLMFLVIQICTQFLFFGPNLMMAEFQLSIFINGLVLGGSSLLSYIFCYFVIGKFKRRKTAIFNYSVVSICCFVLIFTWKPKSQGQSTSVGADVGMLIALFIINFLISVQFSFYQVYIYELFPNQMRINAISFLSVVGGSVIAASDFVTGACMETGFSVMILFTLTGIAGVVVSWLLPQSFEIPPPDLIPQLSQKIKSQRSLASQQDFQESWCNQQHSQEAKVLVN